MRSDFATRMVLSLKEYTQDQDNNHKTIAFCFNSGQFHGYGFAEVGITMFIYFVLQ